SGIQTVVIGNGVTGIGENAFYGCGNLTSVTVPNSVGGINNSAFYECTSLTSISVGAANTKYKSEGGVLFTKDGKRLMVYPAAKADTAYAIPDGVETVDMYAFRYSKNLETLTFPDSVTSIGNYACRSAAALTNATLGSGVTKIVDYLFYQCGKLASVTIPASVTSIETYAFRDCNALEDIYFTGTQDEWDAITVANNNTPVYAANLHVNYVPESGESEEDHLFVMFKESNLTADANDKVYYEAAALVDGSFKEIKIDEGAAIGAGTLYTKPSTNSDGYYKSAAAFEGADTFTALASTNGVNYDSGVLEIAGENFITTNTKVNLILTGGENNVLMDDAGNDYEYKTDISASALSSIMSSKLYDYEYNAFALLNGDGSEVADTIYVYVYEAAEKGSICSTHVWGDWITDTEATTETAGTKHRVCTVCGKRQNGTIPRVVNAAFTLASVALADSISLNFYVPLTAELCERTVCVDFRMDTADGEDWAQSVTLEGAHYDAATGAYVFSYEGVSPQCIDDDVTATLYVDGAEIDALTMSVADYLKSYLDLYDDADALIGALAAYGDAARAYTDYRATKTPIATEVGKTTETAAKPAAEMATAVSESTLADELEFIGTRLCYSNRPILSFKVKNIGH
ncbi:MAG: leucine-rich repeat domain-containing protein, partial [Oscillibacter sp.]|nr:leucine-rich repeat domain-containing protein [Oscillibacter sp.]